ncbi:hypothetical protein ES708_28426 [subsurface metagenome]
MKSKMKINENILAILIGTDGKKKIIRAKNIITNVGDMFYAQKIVGEPPTHNFQNCVLGYGTAASHKAYCYAEFWEAIPDSEKAPEPGYPKRNDTDPDNTGAGLKVATYKYIWAGGDFNHAAISEGCITEPSPGDYSELLTRWLFEAPFAKTAEQVLVLFINHDCLGV